MCRMASVSVFLQEMWRIVQAPLEVPSASAQEHPVTGSAECATPLAPDAHPAAAAAAAASVSPRAGAGDESATGACASGAAGAGVSGEPSPASAPDTAGSAASEIKIKKKRNKEKASAAPGQGKMRVLIESSEWGPHAEAGDGRVWAPAGVRNRLRSTYVCRTQQCVSYAVTRKVRGGVPWADDAAGWIGDLTLN